MRSPPPVVVGLPVRNGAQFLPAALASLSKQSFGDFSLLISDNASSDETCDICADAARLDRRITYQRLRDPVNVSVNFNRLLYSSPESPYFMWAAHDDLWEETYIETHWSRLKRHTGAVLSFCNFDNIDARGSSIREYYHVSELDGSTVADTLSRFVLQPENEGKANLIYGLMDRVAAQRAGGLRPWGYRDFGIDMLFVFRLLTYGRLLLTTDLLFHKRLIESEQSQGSPAAVSTWRRGARAIIAGPIRHRMILAVYLAGYAAGLARASDLTVDGRRDVLAAIGSRLLALHRPNMSS